MPARKQPPNKGQAKPQSINMEQAIFRIAAVETVARQQAPYGVKPDEVYISPALGIPFVRPKPGNERAAADAWEAQSIEMHKNQKPIG